MIWSDFLKSLGNSPFFSATDGLTLAFAETSKVFPTCYISINQATFLHTKLPTRLATHTQPTQSNQTTAMMKNCSLLLLLFWVAFSLCKLDNGDFILQCTKETCRGSIFWWICICCCQIVYSCVFYVYFYFFHLLSGISLVNTLQSTMMSSAISTLPVSIP